MRGKFFAVLFASAVTASLAAAIGAGARPAETAARAPVVTIVGGPSLKPNRFVMDTVRFSPGTITVRPGQVVTWVDRGRSPEPHTVTIVRKGELPDTIQELSRCFEGACGLVAAHLNDPNDPEKGIRTARVDRGRAGLNTRGDSLFLAPKGRISGRVTASSGRTLRYLCALHPWMQGTIRVLSASRVTGKHD